MEARCRSAAREMVWCVWCIGRVRVMGRWLQGLRCLRWLRREGGMQVSDDEEEADEEWSKPRGMRSDAMFELQAARVRSSSVSIGLTDYFQVESGCVRTNPATLVRKRARPHQHGETK